MKREKVINLLKEYFDNGGYFKDLSRRISFKTESQNPKKKEFGERKFSAIILVFLKYLWRLTANLFNKFSSIIIKIHFQKD